MFIFYLFFLSNLGIYFKFGNISEIGTVNIDNNAKFFDNYTISYDPTPTQNGGVACLIKNYINTISIRNDRNMKKP